MLLGSLVCLAALATQDPAVPVELRRLFQAGETLNYSVRSDLTIESRQIGVRTFIPEDLTIEYDFSVAVQSVEEDGIALVRYQRPITKVTSGETFERGPIVTEEPTNYDLEIKLSPINEFIDLKDLAPQASLRNLAAAASARQDLGAAIGQFRDEIYRLALLVGSLDSAVDFSPKLPFTEVVPGDTWNVTVGFQPQGTEGGETQVRRLDYEYTYVGMVETPQGPVRRITGKLNLDTDIAQWLEDAYGVRASDTGLSSFTLKLEVEIEFDLDPVTGHTLRVMAEPEGEVVVKAVGLTSPIREERISGRTLMRRR